MHDDPRLFPHLPPRNPTDADWRLMVTPNEGGVWQTCWEYVLTHELSEAEGSAFWHGASLVFAAMQRAEVES